MKLGALDHMMKPCELKTLIARMDEAVGKRR
jgi:hypothetical protein